MTDFLTLSVDDVITVVRRLLDKQCASDPLPTSVMCEYDDVLEPFLVELFNRSLLQGAVPAVFKSAYITPLLKKADLDAVENKSYTGRSREMLETRCAPTARLPLRCRPNFRPAIYCNLLKRQF